MELFKKLLTIIIATCAMFFYVDGAVADDQKIVTEEKILVASVFANPDNETIVVWGGGFNKESTYTDIHLPNLQKLLSKITIKNIKGKATEGGIVNAGLVSLNPLSIAPVREDLLLDIKRKRIPGFQGRKYNFKVLVEDAGIECLFLVSNRKFDSFGDVVNNAKKLKLYTRSVGSGDLVTLKNIMELYPLLKKVQIHKTSSIESVLTATAADENGIGFFVEMADPKASYFNKIVKQKLHLIPVVSWEIDNAGYDTVEVKVAQAKYIWGDDIFYTTSSSKTMYIIGNPRMFGAKMKQRKMLNYIIGKFESMSPKDIIPSTKTHRDMLDFIKRPSIEIRDALMTKTQETLEYAKKKIDEMKE